MNTSPHNTEELKIFQNCRMNRWGPRYPKSLLHEFYVRLASPSDTANTHLAETEESVHHAAGNCKSRRLGRYLKLVSCVSNSRCTVGRPPLRLRTA